MQDSGLCCRQVLKIEDFSLIAEVVSSTCKRMYSESRSGERLDASYRSEVTGSFGCSIERLHS